MSSKATSLKAKIRNIGKEKGIPAQVVMQNYMFERFLERISLSKYKDNFILKGGMLIASMVGMDTRATMDMDATIQAFPLDEKHIQDVMNEICAIKLDDNIQFHQTKITPTREDDQYGGYKVYLEAAYDSIKTPLSMDITTGDVITPRAIKHKFQGVFDKEKQIELWSYNTETVLAEKVETILRRGPFSTRPRDFYDVYILSKTQEFDAATFQEALEATSKHRESSEKVRDAERIMGTIENSEELRKQWKKYQRQYAYAEGISFEDTIKEVNGVLREDTKPHLLQREQAKRAYIQKQGRER